MKQNLSRVTAYGFAILLISVMLPVILALKKKKNNADCHVQK